MTYFFDFLISFIAFPFVCPDSFTELSLGDLCITEKKDGIMRKDSTTAKLREPEIERNKKLSKVRYIVEQYFGLSHLHHNLNQTRFTTIVKNNGF